MQPNASSINVRVTSSDGDALLRYCRADVDSMVAWFDEMIPLKRQSPMFSAQTRKDFATRGLVAENTLALLSRARGLDLLKPDEQAEYRVDLVAANELSATVRDLRPELGEYIHLEWDAEHAAVVHKLDQVNYPVPGYCGYDAS